MWTHDLALLARCLQVLPGLHTQLIIRNLPNVATVSSFHTVLLRHKLCWRVSEDRMRWHLAHLSGLWTDGGIFGYATKTRAALVAWHFRCSNRWCRVKLLTAMAVVIVGACVPQGLGHEVTMCITAGEDLNNTLVAAAMCCDADGPK